MAARIQRWIVKGLLVGAGLMALAIHHNHVNNPCTSTELGAAGMCVSTTWAGGVR